jgi:hypothetical protein
MSAPSALQRFSLHLVQQHATWPLPTDSPHNLSLRLPNSNSILSHRNRNHTRNLLSKNNSRSLSTHGLQCIYPPIKQSPSPFLRNSHSLSTAAAAAGELFLFGGYVHSSRSESNDLYVISTQDFSTTFLQTGGCVPSPR